MWSFAKFNNNYLYSRQHWIISNGQTSYRKNLCPDVPQGSVLGSLLFLIYKNDLLDGMKLMCKIFPDDNKSIFIVNDGKQSQSTMNKDLERISNRVRKRIMLCNPDPSM